MQIPGQGSILSLTWAGNQPYTHSWGNPQMKSVIAYSIILASAMAASAHLGTLNDPKAGQTYQVGSTLAIRWTIDIAHQGGIDVAYSKANGPWVNINPTILDMNMKAHNWTIPEAAQGSNIRIRICQRPASNGCTDAQNTSQPGGVQGTSLYTLVSGNFTVAAPTSVQSPSHFDGASLNYRSDSRNVGVAFTLAAPEQVTLEAFDTQGKRLSVLMNDRKPEGRHVLSIFSQALPVTTPFILRLQAGKRALQQTMEAR